MRRSKAAAAAVLALVCGTAAAQAGSGASAGVNGDGTSSMARPCAAVMGAQGAPTPVRGPVNTGSNNGLPGGPEAMANATLAGGSRDSAASYSGDVVEASSRHGYDPTAPGMTAGPASNTMGGSSAQAAEASVANCR